MKLKWTMMVAEERESRLDDGFRNVFDGAGDENRTRVSSLEGCGNNHYTTPA